MKTTRKLLSLAMVVIATQYINLTFGIQSALTDSCYKIYEEALNNTSTDLDFSGRIGSLDCSGVQDERYHCLKDENGRQIELCIPWIFIDPGLCPTYVSYNSRMNVIECDYNQTGCPIDAYQSHLFYRYSVCLEGLKVVETSHEPPKTTAAPPTEGSNSAVAIIVVVIILLIIAVGIAVFFILYRKGKICHIGKSDAEKGQELNVFEPGGETTKKLLEDIENDQAEEFEYPSMHDVAVGPNTLLVRFMTEQGDDPVGKLVKDGQSDMESFIKASESKIYLPRIKAQMDATRRLTNNKYVLVTGEQGSGRKVLGREMLVRYMYENYAPVIMHDTMFIPYLMESDKKYAVVFDTSELNPGNEEDTFYSETLKKLNEKDNVMMTVILKKGDYQRLKESGKIDPSMVVDLSARAYQMTNKDKKDLFKKYCAAKKIQIDNDEDLEANPPRISQETMNAICSLDIGKGFPKACEIFFSDKIAFRKGLTHFEGMQLIRK